MSVMIKDNNSIVVESVSSDPTPSPQIPPPNAVTVYHWTVGIFACLLVVVLMLTPSESVQITNLFGLDPLRIDFHFIVAVIFCCGSITCNYFSAVLPSQHGYLTLSMLFYLAAFLSLDPLLAALVPVVASIWFELLVGKRGFAYASRTSGMYIFCSLGASYTYRSLGGVPLSGDLTLIQILQIIASFSVFQLLNNFFYQLTCMLRGEGFLKPFLSSFRTVYPIYASLLPGAAILALLVEQTGIIVVLLGSGLVVSVGVILKRFSDSSLAERSQLARSQQLNAQLARQNERQNTLGNQINVTLDSFLTLVRDYAATSHEKEAAVVEITATIEELSRTAAQIATSTDKVASAADKAIDAADRGQNAVTNTVAAINEVQDKVREISSSILELNRKSEQIGDIVTTITQIAGEIRLLALNATIEASGAGPYGRRFAVVAGEVSDLADRSREASGAIRRIISEIRSATTLSVNATEEGLQTMQRSIAIALQSEKANNEIIEMVERTAQTAAAISLATQQQLSASEQVVNSMHDIASMISGNAQKVADVSVASLELQRVSREMRAGDSLGN